MQLIHPLGSDIVLAPVPIWGELNRFFRMRILRGAVVRGVGARLKRGERGDPRGERERGKALFSDVSLARRLLVD